MQPYPIYATHGRGSHIWDQDGTEYLDFHCGFGATCKRARRTIPAIRAPKSSCFAISAVTVTQPVFSARPSNAPRRTVFPTPRRPVMSNSLPTIAATVISTMVTRAVVGPGPIYGQRTFALQSPSELAALAQTRESAGTVTLEMP